jgi:hypothetical protein
MPLSIIWIVTFALKLLVLHFRVMIFLRSRAKRRFRSEARKDESKRDVVLADQDSPPGGPVRTIPFLHE